MKKIINKIKYNLSFFGVLNSPFKGLKLKFYFGKISCGAPYFLPRKWVKITDEELLEDFCNKNKVNSSDKGYLEFIIDGSDFSASFLKTDTCVTENAYFISREELYIKYLEYKERHKKYLKPKPIKYFGINWCALGWKTKFSSFRYEFPPQLSIVLFGKQFCIWIIPNIVDTYHDHIYWESYLTYKYKTKGTKKERLLQLVEKHTCIWSHYENDEEIQTNHYYDILKPKYLRYVIKCKGWNGKYVTNKLKGYEK